MQGGTGRFGAITNGTGETPWSRCGYYREVCGLAARVDPGTGRITVLAGTVWAVRMPAVLGQLVKMDLDRRGCGGGPVISHPRGAAWTFLVRSDIPAGALAREIPLWRNKIRILDGGAEIVLPSPVGSGVFHRMWITPARGTFRPSGLAVVDSIRLCLTARHVTGRVR